MKDFPFQGWAVGGGGRNVYAFMSGVMSLLNGKEHLKQIKIINLWVYHI